MLCRIWEYCSEFSNILIENVAQPDNINKTFVAKRPAFYRQSNFAREKKIVPPRLRNYGNE